MGCCWIPDGDEPIVVEEDDEDVGETPVEDECIARWWFEWDGIWMLGRSWWGFRTEIHFSFDDGEHVTASVIEGDIEEDDKDDDEVELNFREVFEAKEALKFCCDGAVDGGGGGGRMIMFPLLAALEFVLIPFFFNPTTDVMDNFSVGFLDLVWLVVLSSIQSEEFEDAALFEKAFPFKLLNMFEWPFKFKLLMILEDFGGSFGGGGEVNESIGTPSNDRDMKLLLALFV